MSFTIENIEFFLLILVRISGFIFSAPFFSLPNVPRRVQIGLSLFIAIVIYGNSDKYTLDYSGVIGYAGLVIVEFVVGWIIGFLMSCCILILGFSGQIIDMEIGFSMANVMNPMTNMSTTVTGNLYTYFITLILLGTDLYRYILHAIIDAFTYIPVGKAVFDIRLHTVMVTLIKDYFIIGFRIVLPIFAAMLVVNVVLGVLAKVAPQMNMFVVGMQLKIFVGLIILAIAAKYIPTVADMIYEEMKMLVNAAVKYMTP